MSLPEPPSEWGCNAWIPLYPDQTAPTALTIYPSDPPTLSDDDLYGVLRAVVLRVHTHDPACRPRLDDVSALDAVYSGAAP